MADKKGGMSVLQLVDPKATPTECGLASKMAASWVGYSVVKWDGPLAYPLGVWTAGKKEHLKDHLMAAKTAVKMEQWLEA